MTTELKPCPFCGGEASTWAQVTLHPPGFEIECDSCGASTSADPIEDKAREAWSTRTADKEIERLREALREIQKFGHSDGHGRGYTCATLAREALGDDE